MRQIDALAGAVDPTYIKVQVPGNLTNEELKGLKALLQQMSDDVVQAIQSGHNPKGVNHERRN